MTAPSPMMQGELIIRSAPGVWFTRCSFVTNQLTELYPLPLSHRQGKTISIAGTIQLHDGKPEIEIVSLDQITGLDSQTEQ